MKKNIIVLASSVFAAAVFAADVPQVSNITATQSIASREVTVSYTLNTKAIVTLTVETNRVADVWEPIGDEKLWYVSGDANKVVEAGNHTLTWLPRKAWPNNIITDSKIRIGVKAWALDCPPEIMTVDLKSANTVNYYSSAAALPGGVQDKRYKTDVLVLRHIPAANVTWTMGAPVGELGRVNNEIAHQVTLAADYWIGVYEVTQRQYEILGSSSECENAISYPLFMTGCKEMKTGCKHANDRPFGPLGGPGAVFTCSHPCTSPVWRVSRDRAA